MLLARDAGSIDWQQFHHWAGRLHVGHRVCQGLAFLRDEMNVAITDTALPGPLPAQDWLERLENRAWLARLRRSADAPPSPLDRSVQLARLVAGTQRSALPGLAAGWLRRRLGAVS